MERITNKDFVDVERLALRTSLRGHPGSAEMAMGCWARLSGPALVPQAG